MNRRYAGRLATAWVIGILGFVTVTPACAQTGNAERTEPGAATSTPQFQPTHEQIADSLMAHQRYQAAIEEYQKSSPMTAEGWNKMGVAYQMLFDDKAAEQCYRKALRMEPKNAIAYNNMGSIYMAQKEYGRAEKAYRKAIKIDPAIALFHKNLGTAFLSHRKYKKGWQEYQDALAIDPEIFDHANSIRVQNPSTIQDRGAMNFYMAKGCLKAGLPDRAVYYLRLALDEGFTTTKKIMSDAEFAGLYDNTDFQQMLAAHGVYLTKQAAQSAHGPAQP